jgi:putative copper resistance protein D
VTAIFAVIRWLNEAGLMALYGDAVLANLLRGHSMTLPRGGWRKAAALVALITAPLWLALVVAQMAGDPKAIGDLRVMMEVVTQTLFGQVFVARLALLLLLCASVFLSWRPILTALFSGIGLVAISFTSHAAEASPAHFTAIGIISDALHLLTGGFWIGGLALLAGLFARRVETGLLAGAVKTFSEMGMIAVAVLVLTGMLNAASILLGGAGPDAPLYVGVLCAKLALVLAMIGLALFNQLRLLPRLAQSDSRERLFRHVRWELGLGLGVVLLAMLLTLLPPTLGS